MARFRKELIGKRQWLMPDESPSVPEMDILRTSSSLSPLILSLCWQRGLRDAESIRQFLYPRLDQLTSPLKLKDMDRALERLIQVREKGEKLRVFGDYDVDGTCGAALLHWVFHQFSMPCDVVQPDRFKDGYGLNVRAVEEAHAAGVVVLVTVDCGISSFAAIERGRELGLDIIVLDHHQIDERKGLPPALAVVNPQRADCPSGLRQLCGCGVAFYLAMALRSAGVERAWFKDLQSVPNLKQHLDLVVLATAADMVPLTGDNRILVKQGLEVLRQTQKPGFRALMEVAGLTLQSLSPGHLGFTLGPRINASGRMASAGMAWSVLTTQDPAEGMRLAQTLENLNKERQNVQNSIWDKVRLRVEEGLAQGHFQHAVVLGDESWHEGVVGIVASKVTEIFHKPTIILSLNHEKAKGSVRSYAGKDVLLALKSCEDLLMTYGGHKMAAGLSLEIKNVEALRLAFDAAIAEQKNKDENLLSPLRLAGACQIEDLDLRTLQQLEAFAPFGPGNPEPIFHLQAIVQSERILKERHLKLGLVSADGHRELEAIWFNAAEDLEVYEQVTSDGISHWAGVPEINRYRGTMRANFRILDWRAGQRQTLSPSEIKTDIVRSEFDLHP